MSEDVLSNNAFERTSIVRRHSMKLDIYGRFQLEVVREDDRWVAYRLAPGKRVRVDDLVIPSSFDAADICGYLDDLYHEGAKPGQVVREIE